MRHRHLSAFASLSSPPTPPPPSSSHSQRPSPWPSTATATSTAAHFLLLLSPLSSLLLPFSAASASTLSTSTSTVFLSSSSSSTTAITTTTTMNLIVAGAADSSISVTPPSVLLLPILEIDLALTNLGPLLQPPSSSSSSPSSSSPSDWATAKDILSSPPFTKVEFKRIFNRYADTIYRTETTDVMGGQSAPPAPLQSIQYLYRNEILTACEELRDELSYLLSERAKGPEGDWHDLSGLDEAYGKARENMHKYLSLAPPDDVESVRKALRQQ